MLEVILGSFGNSQKVQMTTTLAEQTQTEQIEQTTFITVSDITVRVSKDEASVLPVQNMFMKMLLILPPPVAINTYTIRTGKTQRLQFYWSDSK